jgi:hypothetical protein
MSVIRVQSMGGTRVTKAGEPREPLRLAVHVVSDLPPAVRGTITNGTAGKDGVRIVTADDKGVATIEYAAPKTLQRSQAELVAVHFATPDGAAGVLLDSVAIAVEAVQ